jgi:hypothetical protein
MVPVQVPAQLALAVSHLFWCQTVEACFAAADPVAALQGQLSTNVAQLAALTVLVHGQLSTLERKVRCCCCCNVGQIECAVPCPASKTCLHVCGSKAANAPAGTPPIGKPAAAANPHLPPLHLG